MIENKRGICNPSKRGDLVRFDWRVSQDVLIKGFKFYVKEGALYLPKALNRFKRRPSWYSQVELSEYLFEEIRRICIERWSDALGPCKNCGHVFSEHREGGRICPAQPNPENPAP
jgi:hypothetical protein